LTKLAISAPRNQLKSGEALGLRLEGEYSDETKKEITDGVAWSSSDAKVATVDDSGRVKAFEAGTVKITARYMGAESSAWTLAVVAPPPVAKAIEPPKKSTIHTPQVKIPESRLGRPSRSEYPKPAKPSQPGAMPKIGAARCALLTRAKITACKATAAALANLIKHADRSGEGGDCSGNRANPACYAESLG
jgi:hypothetical protein